jgi:putative membrane protein
MPDPFGSSMRFARPAFLGLTPWIGRGTGRHRQHAVAAAVSAVFCAGSGGREERAGAMIEHYSDHAANERTFLAWVRTAIAIMAFGFLVAKFDLFLRLEGAASAARAVPGGSGFIGDVAGLALFLLGAAILVLAVIRFRLTARAIDAAEVMRGPGERLDIALVALLVLLGTALFVYLAYTVTGG